MMKAATHSRGRRPLLIPGWPETSRSAIQLFQANNGLRADGVAGPVTRAAVWPGAKSPCVHLAPYALEEGHEPSREATRARLQGEVAGISAEHLLVAVEVLSDGFRRGFSYLSTHQGVTAGLSRLSGSTLHRVVRQGLAQHRWMREACGRYGAHILSMRKPLSRDNGWPLSDVYLRAAFLELAHDRRWWSVQLDELLDFFRRTLARADRLWAEAGRPPWQTGRMLLLALAAHSVLDATLTAATEAEAYRRLRGAYRRRGGAIGRIEQAVGPEEVWRA